MKSQNGITLVALVITIIVLLILAAVTIAALGGQNGILTNASNSQVQNQLGEAKELINLAANEGISSYYTATYVNGIAENETMTAETIYNTGISHIVDKIIEMEARIEANGATLLYVTSGTADKDAPATEAAKAAITGVQVVSENREAGVTVSLNSNGIVSPGWADISEDDLPDAVAAADETT